MSDLIDIETKDFYAMHPTDKGLSLIAKVIAREIPLKFVRVAAGDGYLPDGVRPHEMTALVNHITDLPICSKDDGGGVAVIRCYQSSKGLTEPYDSREIGLFAEDPDEGEILYAYFNAGDRPDFIPSEKSPVVVDWLLALVTIIGRAENIEVTFDANMTFVSHDELESRIAKLFAQTAPIHEFWTRTHGDGNLLRPSSLDDVKYAILGITDIDSMNKRVERIEDVVAQILLELEVANIYPDYTHWICEDFKNPDQVDLYNCKVLSVVAGDDSLDCNPVEGMYPGSWYTVTDGISHELVRVKSVSIENGIQRVILTDPVQNTYRLENARLYRTSTTISENGGGVLGPTGTKTAIWNPSTIWQGQTADQEALVTLPTNVGSADLFITEGSVGFTADGLLTLEVTTNEI